MRFFPPLPFRRSHPQLTTAVATVAKKQFQNPHTYVQQLQILLKKFASFDIEVKNGLEVIEGFIEYAASSSSFYTLVIAVVVELLVILILIEGEIHVRVLTEILC